MQRHHRLIIRLPLPFSSRPQRAGCRRSANCESSNPKDGRPTHPNPAGDGERLGWACRTLCEGIILCCRTATCSPAALGTGRPGCVCSVGPPLDEETLHDVAVAQVDLSKPAWEQEKPLHNRWHPDIPAVRQAGGRRTTGCTPRLPLHTCTAAVSTHIAGAAAHATVQCPSQRTAPNPCKALHLQLSARRACTADCHRQYCTAPPTHPTPLPQVGEAKVGELFRIECMDWTGGQIKDNDSAEDVK